MALVAVNTVLAQAATQLLDANNVRWEQAELLDWFNQGQIEIVGFKPTAYVVTASEPLVEGPKQTIPSVATLLVAIIRNMGLNGTTSGSTIGLVPKQLLDDFTPNWTMATASAVVKHYTYDPNNPKVFYVYPPQPNGVGTQGYVEMQYVSTPTTASLGGNGSLSREYEPALLNYILYRAFSKDAEFSGNVALAESYYKQFLLSVGAKISSEKAA